MIRSMTDKELLSISEIKKSKKIVSFYFEGKKIETYEGLSVAEALMENGIIKFRKTSRLKSHRGPYCLMGVCFDCLLNINGENQRSCQVIVQEGFRVKKPENHDYWH